MDALFTDPNQIAADIRLFRRAVRAGWLDEARLLAIYFSAVDLALGLGETNPEGFTELASLALQIYEHLADPSTPIVPPARTSKRQRTIPRRRSEWERQIKRS